VLRKIPGGSEFHFEKRAIPGRSSAIRSWPWHWGSATPGSVSREKKSSVARTDCIRSSIGWSEIYYAHRPKSADVCMTPQRPAFPLLVSIRLLRTHKETEGKEKKRISYRLEQETQRRALARKIHKNLNESKNVCVVALSAIQYSLFMMGKAKDPKDFWRDQSLHPPVPGPRYPGDL